MDRAILHSDLNCFYASVAVLRDPSLRGKPVAVCGSTDERHGIVLAKTYEAKAYGVKTGQATWEAKRACPGLIVVPPQYELYILYSRMVREVYTRYTDQVEPYGMDECWLDVTGSQNLFGTPFEMAQRISGEIKREIGLTVSVGVSFNKIFAKLGSDMKKPDAITCIPRERFREIVWPLPVGDLLYCGPSSVRRLAGYGVHTIGQLAALDPDFVRSRMGVCGYRLWLYANGNDTARVSCFDYHPPVKSVGHGITCVADLTDPGQVRRVLLELSQDVGHRLRAHGLLARGVEVGVRDSELGSRQYRARLDWPTRLPAELFRAGFALFDSRYDWFRPVRAVTIRAVDLFDDGSPRQLELFEDTERRGRLERIQDAVENVRGRYGTGSLTYASLLMDLKMPRDGRELVRMPGMMYV